MARIAHSAVIAAFDRVAAALADNNGDVQATRQQLRSKGDGEAAYVAGALGESAGTIADASELAAARQVLFARLKEADTSGGRRANGLSKAEIAGLPKALSAMVKALVGMSRLEAVPAKPGPKSIKTFAAAIDHVVTLMKLADGGNGKLSAAENGALAQGLLAEGRGTEALALSNMFTIAKALAGKGATVTDQKIDDVARYALTQIKKRDKGAPGFSNAELETMPTTWAALYRLGRMVESQIAKPVLPQPKAEPPKSGFMTLRDILDNDVGGVAEPVQHTAIPEAARAKIDKTMKTSIRQFTLDGTTPEVSYETLNVDGQTVGYGVLLQMEDANGNNISWNSVFKANGDFAGTEYTGFSGPPARLALAPAMRTEGDWYFTYDDFTPTASFTDPEFRQGFATSQSSKDLFLINLARGELFARNGPFDHRRDPQTNQITAGMGAWELGQLTVEGKSYEVVRWKDVDDAGFTLFFDTLSNPDGYQLAYKNYDG